MVKRILMVCTSLILGISEIHAQSKLENPEILVEGGIKADATFLNFQKKDAPGAISELTPGGTLGGFVGVWFKNWIGIRPELNLNFKQTVMGWEQNSGRMQSFGIEVPIYVVGRLDVFEDHHVYMGLGPYTEFSCYACWMIGERKVDLLEIHESGEPMIQDTQSGFGALFGYEFGNGIGVNMSYKICCFNILQPNTSQGVSLYPQSVSLGFAYKFKTK